jgi:hypothetical protein
LTWRPPSPRQRWAASILDLPEEAARRAFFAGIFDCHQMSVIRKCRTSRQDWKSFVNVINETMEQATGEKVLRQQISLSGWFPAKGFRHVLANNVPA